MAPLIEILLPSRLITFFDDVAVLLFKSQKRSEQPLQKVSQPIPFALPWLLPERLSYGDHSALLLRQFWLDTYY